MEQSKIWDHFQSSETTVDIFEQSTPRYAFLAKYVGEGQRALNIGVGRGGLEQLLLKKGVDTYCLDPGENAIAHIRESFKLAEKAQVGWSQSMPFPSETFDVVIMTEVLEHLDDQILNATLQEVRRVLRNGGRLIGTVPADENLLEGFVMCPKCGESFHRWGHVQSFTRERLLTMFEATLGDTKVERHYFGDWSHLNWKGRIALALKKALVRLGIKGSVENHFFSAQKKHLTPANIQAPAP